MKHVSGLVLMVASLIAAPYGAFAEEQAKIHECTDARGSVVYQDAPCVDVVPVAPKPAARPTAAPRTTVPPAKPRPQAPPPVTGSVDRRWASPETTLKTFVSAVTAGDRALVLECLTSSALVELGPDPAAVPLAQLQELVGSFRGYVPEGDLGPVWSIRAKRSGQRPKWIFFERTRTGEWKIAAI